MQIEVEEITYYQTKPYFFTDKCRVTKTKKDSCIEYSCLEKAVYFEMELFLKEDCVNIHITDIVTEPTNSGIGKSIFAYFLKEAVYICNDNQRKSIKISGLLSTSDYMKGHWPDSLLAYKRLGQSFSLDFYITDMETDPAYTDCSELLKKEIYTEIKDFFNPELGKINSGYLHYDGDKAEIEIALDGYYKFIQGKINEIEEAKSRKHAENQRLIQQSLESSNKSLSLIAKIKRIFNI